MRKKCTNPGSKPGCLSDFGASFGTDLSAVVTMTKEEGLGNLALGKISRPFGPPEFPFIAGAGGVPGDDGVTGARGVIARSGPAP